MNKKVRAIIKDDFTWFVENIAFMSQKEQIAFLTVVAEFAYESGAFKGMSEMAGYTSEQLEKSLDNSISQIDKGGHDGTTV